MKRLDASIDCRPWYMPSEQLAASEQLAVRNEQVVFEEARARGYQEGLLRAHEEAAALAQRELAQVKEILQAEARIAAEATGRVQDRLEALIREIKGLIDEQARCSHELAVEVAFQAVSHTIGSAYANASLLADLCREAIRSAGHQAVALYVSEQDLELCTPMGDLPVRCDLALRQGQCTLETRAGRVDFGLDVRLSALQAALLDGLSRHRLPIAQ